MTPQPPVRNERPNGVVLAAMVTAVALWASAFVAIRDALHWFSPGALALGRYVVATSALTVCWVVVSRRSGRPLRLPARRDVPRLAFFGLLMVTVYNLGLNYGERTVTPGTASFLIGQIPVFSTLLAIVLLGERLTRRAALGVGIGVAGTAVLLFSDNPGLRFNVGAVYVLAAVAAGAVYYVLAKSALDRYRALELNVFVAWPGTLLLAPFAGPLVHEVAAAPARGLLAVVYLGVFPAAVAFVAWSYALARATVSGTTSALYLVPWFTIVIGVVWLGEWPNVLGFVGGAVALVGAVVVTRERLRRSAAGPPPDD